MEIETQRLLAWDKGGSVGRIRKSNW